MGLVSAFLDLLYPPRCVFCRKLVERREGLICPDCRKHLPYTAQVGKQHGDFFKVCVAPLYYEGKVRDSLHRYKFSGASSYSETYGALLADCVRSALDGEFDLISWVPLSRKRLRERGYDQSKLLAEAAAKELGYSVTPVLYKVKDVAKQSTVGAEEKRRANIAEAYRAADPEQIAGKRILLIDDIITTGATLSECAGTLKRAGAAEVVCAALARSKD